MTALRSNYGFYYELQSKGVIELWTYTCAAVAGTFPDRHMDVPTIRNRLIHWVNFLYGVQGYLHWAYNYRWDYLNNPQYEKEGKYGISTGDAFTVWPGEDGPISTCAMRRSARVSRTMKILCCLWTSLGKC